MSVEPRLDRLLDERTRRSPDALALASDGRRVSYGALSDLERRIATALHGAGLAGERVAFLLPNGVELVACYLGCWRAGVTAVPFEYVDAPPEIAYGLGDCAARWLIVHEDKLADLAKIDLARTSLERVLVVGRPGAHQERFDQLLATPPRTLPDVAAETLAFILYTSGSTALPKGVTHTHASAAGIARSVLDALARVGDASRIVVHDSVSHMGGWIETFPFLWRGGSVVLERDFEVARFYDDLRTWRPTVLGAHVDHLWQIVRHAAARRDDFASLEVVFTGGDELPLGLQHDFLTSTGLPIVVGWGMTEAIWLTIARQPELARRGFLGKPVAEVELRVADVAEGRVGQPVPDGEAGELWVRGPMVTPGYWRRPEADRAVLADGWLRSGDMGLRDARGDYWFTGRLKQIIERSSENVTPGEIEQALYRHPAVAEAAAFGVADPAEGQVPIAYVRFADRTSATEQELKGFLATQLAAFKIPVRILPIDHMPLTHSGKLDHKTLAERYASEATR